MNTTVDRTFTALADPMRRAVVDLLKTGPRRPSDIADELAASRPAISRHLRVLRQCGVVREQIQTDDARQRLYRLCPEPFDDLRHWLDDVEAFWEDQLDAFQTHVERRAKPARSPRGHT